MVADRSKRWQSQQQRWTSHAECELGGSRVVEFVLRVAIRPNRLLGKSPLLVQVVEAKRKRSAIQEPVY